MFKKELPDSYLLIFGSAKMNLHLPNSDLDIVLIND